jgi:hypothetical protein
MENGLKLSKAGRRRLNAQVKELRELCEKDPIIFRRQWHKRVQGWLHEVHRRANNWAEGTEFRNAESREGIIERGRTHVFGVVEIAEHFIKACGTSVSERVEKDTLSILSGECTKAVAAVIDRRLNYLVDKKYKR